MYLRGTTGPLFLSFSTILSLVGESEVATQPSSGVVGWDLPALDAAFMVFVGDTDSGELSGLRSHGRDFLLGTLGTAGGGLVGIFSCGGVKPMIV